MKRQIIIATINLCSLTWAMEHKAEQKQTDPLKPLFNPAPPQSMERSQDAALLLPRLSGHATDNTTSFHKTSLFMIHRDRAKL